MLRRLLTLIIAVFVISGLLPVRFNGYVNYALGNSLVEDDIKYAAQNARELNKLVAKAVFNKRTDIHLPEGKYYIDSSVMGIKCIGVKNLSFKGNKTLLVNTSYNNKSSLASVGSNFFYLKDCKNISIEGISFDYLDRCSINGVIQKSDGGELKIRISDSFADDKTHTPLKGGEMAAAVNEIDFSDGVSIISDTYFSEDSKTSYNPKTHIYTVKNTTGYNLWEYQKGNTAVIRCSNGTNIMPMFSLDGVCGFKMKDVNVYSCPGTTVYGSFCSGKMEFDNLKIAPQSDFQIYSSNTDGIHLNNQTGEVILTDCSFKGMGDDSLNVNSQAAKIMDGNGKKFTFKYARDESKLDSRWVKKGDILKFFDKSWEPAGQSKVKSVHGSKLKMCSGIPYSGKSLYVQNTRLVSKITIKNTSVDTTRARAFLIRSDKADISGCDIRNTALAGIIVAADIATWYEMSPSQNIKISSNRFFNCCTENSASNFGAISVKCSDDANYTNSSYKIHKNITIDNNTIQKCPVSAIYVSSTDGIKVRGNDLENICIDPSDGRESSSHPIAFYGCKAIVYDGNTDNGFVYKYNCD